MKRRTLALPACFFLLAVAFPPRSAARDWPQPPDPESPSEYFRVETEALQRRCLADIHTLQDWEARRLEYRRQLQEMLGLWPMPEKTDLHPVITGTLEREDFVVEKLYFQASPRLYVTANLYRPKRLEKPAPAILYVCGHSREVTNGVSCGNKVGYQHHGAWFARNGYVCLTIDTLQLGEIEGVHHGTYREGQWWWNCRGYSPAGVEAWFGIRAVDYLCSRPEVDRDKIGMTGRSGGGSYTWTVAALDDRVKVAAPVAGITDLQNQVVDGAVEGHCDCMFFVNTYRWDFPLVAALVAPRPLLIANSDKDTIFPLDGVVRLHSQARRIYQLYGATNHLGLLITEGPHSDTQDLQVPVFRWFNRFLKGGSPLIEMAAKPFFTPDELRVFNRVPADELNTKIQGMFVPVPSSNSFNIPKDAQARAQLTAELREKVFAGWPDKAPPAAFQSCGHSEEAGLRRDNYSLATQPGINLPLLILRNKRVVKPQTLVLTVLDSQTWSNSPANPAWPGFTVADLSKLQDAMRSERSALAFFSPRAVTPAEWMKDPRQVTHLRRRYMLLGQTLDGQRVWDIRCAVQALKSLPDFRNASLRIQARGEMGVNAAYGSFFEPTVARLDISELPASHVQGPDYLNVLKILDLPIVLDALGDRTHH